MAILLDHGELVSVPPAGKSYIKLNDSGTPVVVAPDGTTATVGAQDAATNTTAGSMPATSMAASPRTCPDFLIDDDQEISPAVDGYSRYIMPAGTLTDDRVITIDNTGVAAAMIVELIFLDTSEDFGVTVKKNDGTTTIFTKVADTPAQGIQAFVSSGDWILSTVWFTGT
jgi:hypothetical protein